jgi:GT2 family glycosyltransferase
MIFHKSIWEAVGVFDESREHGEDTDFAIRCEKGGATIFDLPVDVVPHYDTDSNFTILEHAEWLFYLLRRHPSSMAIPASKLFLRWILF